MRERAVKLSTCASQIINNFVSFCRGHTVNAVCESFTAAKDAGFKVVAHMMPDLPNVGLERDIEQFIVRGRKREGEGDVFYYVFHFVIYLAFFIRSFLRILPSELTASKYTQR